MIKKYFSMHKTIELLSEFAELTDTVEHSQTFFATFSTEFCSR